MHGQMAAATGGPPG